MVITSTNYYVLLTYSSILLILETPSVRERVKKKTPNETIFYSCFWRPKRKIHTIGLTNLYKTTILTYSLI